MEYPVRARPAPRALFTPACRRAAVLPALLLSGCGNVQSSLRPAGTQAELIAGLFWLMAGGALLVWLAVIGFALYATVLRPGRHSARGARRVIVYGGAVLPALLLGALLAHGLALMPQLRPALPADALRVAVTGEQWWWRVQYRLPDGRRVTAANEIRLPVGASVEFLLASSDVIHSFWIPSLGGKVDMTPGRSTRLVLTPTRTGVFRGACAEYCGASHARMNFLVVVMEPDAFAAWLEDEARDALPPRDPLAVRGARAFEANGCGACHAVRGSGADGVIGPDLTHVGSRRSLAAATLPNDRAALRDWIAHAQSIKPEARMPAFGMLPREEIEAIAAYLEGLE